MGFSWRRFRHCKLLDRGENHKYGTLISETSFLDIVVAPARMLLGKHRKPWLACGLPALLVLFGVLTRKDLRLLRPVLLCLNTCETWDCLS